MMQQQNQPVKILKRPPINKDVDGVAQAPVK